MGCSAAPSSSADDSPRQADLPYPMSAWTWDQQQADWMQVPSGQAGLGLQVCGHSALALVTLRLSFCQSVLPQERGLKAENKTCSGLSACCVLRTCTVAKHD